MPRKVREIESDYRRAGFARIAGKGSHRRYRHPAGIAVTVSGQPGDDAEPYQERDLERALEEIKKRSRR